MHCESHRPSPAAAWTGRVVGALVVLILSIDAGVCLFAPELLAENMQRTGFPQALCAVIGGVLVVCIALFVIPVTSVLGAVLLTGFLGGAICTHLRLGEIGSPPQLVCLLLGAARGFLCTFETGPSAASSCRSGIRNRNIVATDEVIDGSDRAAPAYNFLPRSGLASSSRAPTCLQPSAVPCARTM